MFFYYHINGEIKSCVLSQSAIIDDNINFVYESCEPIYRVYACLFRVFGWMVGWSLTSLFSTNTAISETFVSRESRKKTRVDRSKLFQYIS